MTTSGTDYVYLHAKPQGDIFYVGKGRGDRYLPSKGRNKHHKHIVFKYGSKNIEVAKIECSSHSIALDLEIGIIKCLLRSGVSLVNQTRGGEGALGRSVSEATRVRLKEKLSGKALRKKPISPEEVESLIQRNKSRRKHPPVDSALLHAMEGMTRGQKISYRAKLNSAFRSQRVMGDKNPMHGGHTAEAKQKLSLAMRGQNNPFFGKTHSDETKKRLSDSHATRQPVKCPHCDKIGKPEGMLRWHFDNCRDK